MPQIGFDANQKKVVDEDGVVTWVSDGTGDIYTDRDSALPCETPMEPMIEAQFLASKFDFIRERLRINPDAAKSIVTLTGGSYPEKCGELISFSFYDTEVTCPKCGCVYTIHQSG